MRNLKITDLLRRYTLVHKCAGCSDILDFEHFDKAFCSDCELSWRAALTESCNTCFKPAVECECMPKLLSKEGALCLRRMFFYKSEHSGAPQMRAIYYLKDNKIRRVADFAAEQLCPTVRAELDVLGADVSEVVICNVPRSKSSRVSNGFDQAEMVARSLGRRLGISYRRVLISSARARVQKKLDKRERAENAKKNIAIKRGADVKGKYVVLFDDMVTTGASMAASVSLLRKSGAIGVLCFSLASKEKL